MSATNRPVTLSLAPGVTLTRLPHGGAVLVNATTLDVTECGEPEAALIEHLLAHGLPAASTEPAFRPVAGLPPVAGPLPGFTPPPGAEPHLAPPAAPSGAATPPPAVLRGMARQLTESGWLCPDPPPAPTAPREAVR